MNNSIRTQKFLRLIARRLSGREDCKRMAFQIGIGELVPGSIRFLPENQTIENYISFSPEKFVYRDTFHRKDTDLFPIVEFILRKYFEDLILGVDKYGQIIVDTSKFVKGVYEYQTSMDGKRRRWVKQLNVNR